MNTITLPKFTLEDLLPHRGDMMLVHEILEVDRNHAQVVCRVARQWPLAEERGVHCLILVELAAQTAGVCNGWDRIHTKGLDSESTGWLVGIKKADFFIDYLPFDARVLSRAENIHNFEQLREVSCEQYLDDVLIGKIILQLFQA